MFCVKSLCETALMVIETISTIWVKIKTFRNKWRTPLECIRLPHQQLYQGSPRHLNPLSW